MRATRCGKTLGYSKQKLGSISFSGINYYSSFCLFVYKAIIEQLERRTLVVSRQKTFVETIEPSGDALSMGLSVTSEVEFLE
jgi:hypothetical protein